LVHLARGPRYTAGMNIVFLLAILAAMIATVVALVRGIVAFLKTTEADLKGGGISQSGLKQNRMMRMRIAFQAIAVILIVLLLILSRK
jgi:hypothetical protein